jgi:hypothetical protein
MRHVRLGFAPADAGHLDKPDRRAIERPGRVERHSIESPAGQNLIDGARRPTALGGERAYEDRFVKDRSPRESRHSVESGKYASPERPYAKRSISASASAISGISGVGEKPLSAGARTARASAGRAVD